MVELISKEISQYNKKVSLGEDISEEFLIDINQLQDNTMLIRENIVDKQRVATSLTALLSISVTSEGTPIIALSFVNVFSVFICFTKSLNII